MDYKTTQNVCYLGTFISLLFVLGCNTPSSQADNTQPELSQISAQNETKSPEVKCGAMPPIQNKQKLVALLTERGKITPDMTQEQVEEVVAEYIRNKQKKFTDCPQPKSIKG